MPRGVYYSPDFRTGCGGAALAGPPGSPGEVDADVEVEVLVEEVLEFAAFDDPEPVVAGGEGLAFGADPCGGDEDSGCGAFFLDGAGQGADVVSGDASMPGRARGRWADPVTRLPGPKVTIPAGMTVAATTAAAALVEAVACTTRRRRARRATSSKLTPGALGAAAWCSSLLSRSSTRVTADLLLLEYSTQLRTATQPR